VLAQVFGPATEGLTQVPADKLGNTTHALAMASSVPAGRPAVAAIYQLDSLVRRASALQLTADARHVAASQAQQVKEQDQEVHA
jgi:NADH-quinone oxidoreductase subunit G